MTYASELIILSLTNSFIYSIFLTVLYLLLACQLCNAEMLIACQSLCGSGKRDSNPEQEGESNAGALHFFNTGVSLQRLAQILHQSFKLKIISAIA